MCGIFACFNTKHDIQLIRHYFNKIQHRGPDMSKLEIINEQKGHIMGFHRLAIVNTSEEGMQPFSNNGVYLVCNGEIFNHKEIEQEINKCKPDKTFGSDCECILDLVSDCFNKYRIVEDICNKLDAEFVFIAYDTTTNTVIVARDPQGVRPLFYGTDKNGGIYFASEAKAIDFVDIVKPFPPSVVAIVDLNSDNVNNIFSFYNYTKLLSHGQYIDLAKEPIQSAIRGYFIEAVKKRTMSDRVVGCLLSGGLDSSLVASVLVKFLPEVHFFSIGLRDSVDVIAAKRVTEYLKVPKEQHHIVEFLPEEGLAILEEVIQQLETYDITTIRASVPQYLLAKYISNKTNVVVIYSGEGSDELMAGYAYFKSAPTSSELQTETEYLLDNLYMYDNLRTDRTTACWGLEVRVPFLDKDFVKFVHNIDPKYKMSNTTDCIEKSLLRDAFKGWLPDEILYRPKEAFSDAVSSKEVSWYKSLQDLIQSQMEGVNLEQEQTKYEFNPPISIEALYYRRIFNKYYPNRDHLINRYWMPKWQTSDLKDPSATALKTYTGDLVTK